MMMQSIPVWVDYGAAARPDAKDAQVKLRGVFADHIVVELGPVLDLHLCTRTGDVPSSLLIRRPILVVST